MTVAWVRAHTGDIRNELADARAGAGIWSDIQRWDGDTHPIALYSMETTVDMVPAWVEHCCRADGN
jgi:hypothetical protein